MNKKENKVRQYRSNQGRDPRQQESNYKMMFISCCGMLLTLLSMIIYGIFS